MEDGEARCTLRDHKPRTDCDAIDDPQNWQLLPPFIVSFSVHVGDAGDPMTNVSLQSFQIAHAIASARETYGVKGTWQHTLSPCPTPAASSGVTSQALRQCPGVCNAKSRLPALLSSLASEPTAAATPGALGTSCYKTIVIVAIVPNSIPQTGRSFFGSKKKKSAIFRCLRFNTTRPRDGGEGARLLPLMGSKA